MPEGASPSSQSTGSALCEACGQPADEFVYIEYGNNIANLCGWLCTIRFAAERAKRGALHYSNAILEAAARTSQTVALASAFSGDPNPHIADQDLDEVQRLAGILKQL